MSRLKFCNDLKIMLVYDERTKDFTVGQIRTVFNIIDELYDRSKRYPFNATDDQDAEMCLESIKKIKD